MRRQLNSVFPIDANGHTIVTALDKVNVSGSVTDQKVFEGVGILLGILIWKDVDGGTLTIKDKDGTTIYPAGVTDYAGNFPIGGNAGHLLENGCYITTANATGLAATVFFAE